MSRTTRCGAVKEFPGILDIVHDRDHKRTKQFLDKLKEEDVRVLSQSIKDHLRQHAMQNSNYRQLEWLDASIEDLTEYCFDFDWPELNWIDKQKNISARLWKNGGFSLLDLQAPYLLGMEDPQHRLWYTTEREELLKFKRKVAEHENKEIRSVIRQTVKDNSDLSAAYVAFINAMMKTTAGDKSRTLEDLNEFVQKMGDHFVKSCQ